jgi:hypothetical protein
MKATPYRNSNLFVILTIALVHFNVLVEGESTLHPMYFLPKKKYKKVLILYFFGKKNLGFDF